MGKQSRSDIATGPKQQHTLTLNDNLILATVNILQRHPDPEAGRQIRNLFARNLGTNHGQTTEAREEAEQGQAHAVYQAG